MIIFDGKSHETAFNKVCSQMKYLDCYHLSLAYLLTLDTVLREHINEVFDFKTDGIKPDCMYNGFQTDTSIKTTRLAFNLWNGYYDEGETYIDEYGSKQRLPSIYFMPDNIFCCTFYAPYYWEAIKLRFGIS